MWSCANAMCEQPLTNRMMHANGQAFINCAFE